MCAVAGAGGVAESKVALGDRHDSAAHDCKGMWCGQWCYRTIDQDTCIGIAGEAVVLARMVVVVEGGVCEFNETWWY